MNSNGSNGFKRDTVEKVSALLIMGSLFAFVAVAVYGVAIAIFRDASPPQIVRDIILLVAGGVLTEAKGIVVGRGEGGTFEGKQLTNGRGAIIC